MNLISENIANTNTTKTQDGTPYQRKFLVVKQKDVSLDGAGSNAQATQGGMLRMNTTNPDHIASAPPLEFSSENSSSGLNSSVVKDNKVGDMVYMPEHPDADPDGYVHMPNVNIVTEMVDMITATRSYESNLTALNSSKQMAKDTLEI
ncbi:MAG: flagellar basal body rod protein FlgC [Syntrophomonadaceae bacterium]